ncbi:acyclic terpene utilization AtuA family protein [Caballeronia sp. 15711]|uniref:acyclic terpene utilization AtuA family protein n=1 Tax=Caballeronia sp. 15711 TaxID=3391029 RepID=UPI0039E31B8D
MTPKDEVRILTPTGMFGYGFPLEWFKKGVALKPHAITVDSGSTDSGPQKLGLGSMTCSPAAYMNDFAMVLDAGFHNKIPIYISSAGGDGTDAHVDVFFDMVREISRHKGYRFKAAAIYGDIDKDLIKQRMRANRVRPLSSVGVLTEDEVDAASNIVAQMGAEPFIAAHEQFGELDLIISARAYDPAPTAALGIMNGMDPALSWHMGKVMECGALCAEPTGRNIFGVLREEYFELEPLNPEERCTTYSVAAHTLYEKSHPYFLHGPGGMLDLSDCKYEQVTERRVRVSGSKFVPEEHYSIKLEGAKRVGYRSISIQGTRDPVYIRIIDEVAKRIEHNVRTVYFPDVPQDSYEIVFHMYGKNGVMGELEPNVDHQPMELCVITEVAAVNQDLATAICGRVRTELLHTPYPGRIATAGNMASPFTPLEIPLGEVCKFNIYHLMEVDSPNETFPIKYLEI